MIYHKGSFNKFILGGKGDWRTFTTLPNILKVFNPNIIGYSVGIFDYIFNQTELSFKGTFKDKGFNFGKSDALSKDIVQQSKELVIALENNPRINMNTDWKVINHALYIF